MRKFFALILTVTIGIIAFVVVDKIRTNQDFGLASYAFIAVLGLFALFTTWSLHCWKSRERRLTVLKLWTLMIASVGSYVVLDLALGAILNKRLSPFMQADSFVHHRPIPNQAFEVSIDGRKTTHHVNSLGLRGGEIPIEKPDGEYRILALGDSFTAGKGVEDNETFSALLEKKLHEAGQHSVRVINCGVDSYSPLLSYMQYSKELHELKPDLVIYNFDMSDLTQNERYLGKGEFSDDGEFLKFRFVMMVGEENHPGQMFVPGSRIKKVRNWIDKRTVAMRWVLANLDEWRGKGDNLQRASGELLEHTLPGDSEDRSKQWESVFKYIGKLREAVESDGSKFMMTTYPWGHQVGGGEWAERAEMWGVPKDVMGTTKSIEKLATYAQENQVVFLSLLDAFRAHKQSVPDSKLYFSADMHWTTEGHEVFATALTPFVLKQFFSAP